MTPRELGRERLNQWLVAEGIVLAPQAEMTERIAIECRHDPDSDKAFVRRETYLDDLIRDNDPELRAIVKAERRAGRMHRIARPWRQRMMLPPIDVILVLAGHHYGVTRRQIRSANRTAPVSAARAVACRLIRELWRWSYPDIARAIDHANHTTVISACKRADAGVVQRITQMMGLQQQRAA
jgi:hypothetical protein